MALYRYTKNDATEFFSIARSLKKESSQYPTSPRLDNMMKRWKALQILRQIDPHVHMKTPNLSNKITAITKMM